MTIEEIDAKRKELVKKAEQLGKEFKELYGNVDIESPKSPEEKKLEAEKAAVWSEINNLVMLKRKLKNQ